MTNNAPIPFAVTLTGAQILTELGHRIEHHKKELAMSRRLSELDGSMPRRGRDVGYLEDRISAMERFCKYVDNQATYTLTVADLSALDLFRSGTFCDNAQGVF